MEIDADHLGPQLPSEYRSLQPGSAAHHQQLADRGASALANDTGKCFGLAVTERGVCAFERGSENLSHQQIPRSEEHTSELQSQSNLVCRLLLEKKNNI